MPDQRDKAGAAAIAAIKKCGLCGRPDSPPEWDQALNGATAGEPILVKHPTDERDDFFLVPLNPTDPTARLGVWAMLDTKTLELREASLLKDWRAPAFPDPDKDIQQLSQSPLKLADGTVKKFEPYEITSNHKNLVWASSAAAVLPYWPVKEFTVPHPVTGTPEKIYLNQEGEFHPSLGPDDPGEIQQPKNPSPTSSPNPNPNNFMNIATKLLAALSLPLLGWNGYLSTKLPDKPVDISKLENQIASLNSHVHNQDLHKPTEMAPGGYDDKAIRRLIESHRQSPHSSPTHLEELNQKIRKLEEQLTKTGPAGPSHTHKLTDSELDRRITEIKTQLNASKKQSALDLKVRTTNLQEQINNHSNLINTFATKNQIVQLQGQINALNPKITKAEGFLTKPEVLALINSSLLLHSKQSPHGGRDHADLTKRLNALEINVRSHTSNNKIHDGNGQPDKHLALALANLTQRLNALEKSLTRHSANNQIHNGNAKPNNHLTLEAIGRRLTAVEASIRRVSNKK